MVGDEVGFSEELYHQLIGRYVATIEVLTKRLVLKDQHISKLESDLQNPSETPKLQEGDMKFGE